MHPTVYGALLWTAPFSARQTVWWSHDLLAPFYSLRLLEVFDDTRRLCACIDAARRNAAGVCECVPGCGPFDDSPCPTATYARRPHETVPLLIH